jgi:hypothetical protein
MFDAGRVGAPEASKPVRSAATGFAAPAGGGGGRDGDGDPGGGGAPGPMDWRRDATGAAAAEGGGRDARWRRGRWADGAPTSEREYVY